MVLYFHVRQNLHSIALNNPPIILKVMYLILNVCGSNDYVILDKNIRFHNKLLMCAVLNCVILSEVCGTDA